MKRTTPLPQTLGALLTTLHVMINSGVSPDTVVHVFDPDGAGFYPVSLAEYGEGSMTLNADDDYDEEIPRWQNAIRKLCIAECGQDVDGTGCESGDPLDVTLTEIALAFNVAKEHRDAQCKACPTIVPLNDETRWILGRPNFWCASVAQVLREDGHEIKKKAEDEQAAVIHWLLNLYLKHGDKWRDFGIQEQMRIKYQVEERLEKAATE